MIMMIKGWIPPRALHMSSPDGAPGPLGTRSATPRSCSLDAWYQPYRGNRASEYFTPENRAKFKSKKEQEKFDRQCESAREHTRLAEVRLSSRAMHRKGYRIDTKDGMIYRHFGQRPGGQWTNVRRSDNDDDYGSGVVLPQPEDVEQANERLRAEMARASSVQQGAAATALKRGVPAGVLGVTGWCRRLVHAAHL